jgi:RimJ/RimL family protein N-acetyltransferase
MNPELTVGPLLLRPFQSDDVDVLYSAIVESLPELSRWFWWAHDGYQKEETVTFVGSLREAWEQRGDSAFGVFDSTSRELLGAVGINEIDKFNGHCNLGYWMKTSATRRGIASLAARRVAEYALMELGMQRVEVVMAAENVASRRVAEKIGAVREGIARKRFLLDGKPQDGIVHSLIAEDLH